MAVMNLIFSEFDDVGNEDFLVEILDGSKFPILNCLPVKFLFRFSAMEIEYHEVTCN